jgi:hypothetical protein
VLATVNTVAASENKMKAMKITVSARSVENKFQIML